MQYLKRNNLKVVEDLKIQVALLVHTISSKTGTEKSKATQTESNISWVERAPMHKHLSCVGEIVSLVPKHTEYNWGLCKKKFTTKKEFMQHKQSMITLFQNVKRMKMAHVDLVNMIAGLNTTTKHQTVKIVKLKIQTIMNSKPLK